MKVLLFPFVIEQVVVALDAVQADAEESARNAACQLGFVRGLRLLVLVNGYGDEIDFRLCGPDAAGIDEASGELIVGTILMNLFTEPIG